MNESIFYYVIGTLVVIAVFSIYFAFKRKKSNVKNTSNSLIDNETEDVYIQKSTAQYGQPDDIITVSSMLSAIQRKPLLVYPNFLLIEGIKIPKKDIIDVTFNNSANPYVANDYQVIVSTRIPSQEYIHLSVGNDIEMAGQVADQIRGSLA